MLDISNALYAETGLGYFDDHYASPSNSYLSEKGKRVGQWLGLLVPALDLENTPLTREAVAHLMNGQHPITGAQLVRHRTESTLPDWVTDDAAWAKRLAGHYEAAAELGRDLTHGFDQIEISPPKQRAWKLKPVAAPDYTDRQKQIIEMNRIAAELFRSELAGGNGEEAREYLAGRKIGQDLVDEFGLGLGLRNSWQLHDAIEAHWRERGLAATQADELMESSGLFYQTDGGQLRARFAKRLIIPIQDAHGNIIAFAGRDLTGKARAKYMNSPETTLYKKSEIVFNAHRARQMAAETDGKAVIVEGYFDAIAAHGAGVAAVAAAGTAFTEEHAAQLKTITSAPVISMDADAGGFRATAKITGEMLAHGISPRVMILTRDADEFIADHGATGYRREVKQARDLIAGLATATRLQAIPGAKPGEAGFSEADAAKATQAVLAKADPKLRVAIDRELAAFLGSEVAPVKAAHMGHRAGFDGVFNAPKSVSLTAMLGDDRGRLIHERAAIRAATAIEEFAQAHGRARNETTGKWIAAIFQHDTARPVDGVTAAHLHTHVFFFNVQQNADGEWRALEPLHIFKAKRFGQAVYQAELAHGLRELGYKIRRGKVNAPEIEGYSQDYLDAESLRHKLIKDKVEALGMYGRRAESIVQHQDREAKLDLTAEELRTQLIERAEKFGNQHLRVIEEAKAAKYEGIGHEQIERRAMGAVRYAKEKLAANEAVFTEYDVLAQALRYGRGYLRIEDVETALERQIGQGRMIPVHHVAPNAPKRRLTTPEQIRTEHATLERMFRGMGQAAPMPVTEEMIRERFPQMNDGQRAASAAILVSRDQIMGVRGKAGVGKNYMLRAVAPFAREHGWQVLGLGPTGKAAIGFGDSGIESVTLQKFQMCGGRIRGYDERPILHVIDEASLADAMQVHDVAARLRACDRLVVMGDTRQHQSVGAGRIFEQLEDAGMPTPQLTRIVRQKDEGLRQIVEKLSDGQVVKAVEQLRETGRVVQIPRRDTRLRQLARDYAAEAEPEKNAAICPDNATREELSLAIRDELRQRGHVMEDAAEVKILVQRQEVSGPDREFASAYQVGDVVWYQRGSEKLGIAAGSRGKVASVDSEANVLRVEIGGRSITYNPHDCHGVSVYEERERKLAVGDRIQFTAPWRAKGIVTRDTATILGIDGQNVRARFDRTGQVRGWALNEHRHIEYAYAWTSHSLECATVDKVFAHIETGDSRLRSLVNETLGYVGLSRGAGDVRVYTDDESALAKSLSRVQRNTMALAPEEIGEVRARVREKRREMTREEGYAVGA